MIPCSFGSRTAVRTLYLDIIERSAAVHRQHVQAYRPCALGTFYVILGLQLYQLQIGLPGDYPQHRLCKLGAVPEHFPHKRIVQRAHFPQSLQSLFFKPFGVAAHFADRFYFPHLGFIIHHFPFFVKIEARKNRRTYVPVGGF